MMLPDADVQRIAVAVVELMVARMPAAPAEPLLTTQELADALRVTPAQVDRFVRKGMPRTRVGARPRFELAACRRWLASSSGDAVARAVDPLENVTPVGRAPKV
jgi:hypothetical protein